MNLKRTEIDKSNQRISDNRKMNGPLDVETIVATTLNR